MSKQHIYLDYETFSEVNLFDCGIRRYVEGKQFRPLWLSVGRYINKEKVVETFDLVHQPLPERIRTELIDPNTIKHAWNVTFERLVTEAWIGVPITDYSQWQCTMVKAYYCGLPGKLSECCRVIGLPLDVAKVDGKDLIRLFSVPARPSKVNEGKNYNAPEDYPEYWENYGYYNKRDVIAEMEIDEYLDIQLPEMEQRIYQIDQVINARGVKVNIEFAQKAYDMGARYAAYKLGAVNTVASLNPKSTPQVIQFLKEQGVTVPLNKEGKESVDKSCVKELLSNPDLPEDVVTILQGRQQLNKTSVTKYAAMLLSAQADHRVRGLLQYYGANRTGRFAGRLVQIHNLPQNHYKHIDLARQCVFNSNGDYEAMELLHGDTPTILSQLIRTAFIPEDGNVFVPVDFSAIEARVTAWFAEEQWRLDVFATHGKIYEASASQMFHVPIEFVTKGSTYRDKGKVAELALGFGGNVGALLNFGADKMGMSDAEMKSTVKLWRKASPNIVAFWGACEDAAIQAVRNPGAKYYPTLYPGEGKQIIRHNLCYQIERDWLTLTLPSGRKLFYYKPMIVLGKFGDSALSYMGKHKDETGGAYVRIDTWGGKLCENAVQATAADLLREKMILVHEAGYYIVFHVHDELVSEVPREQAEFALEHMEYIMGIPVVWAPGLPLSAEGFITNYYKKG